MSVSSLPRRRLTDPHGRPITYLRLAITDRCNLRCRYCMQPGSIRFLPRDELLTFEELERLAVIFVSLGIRKIRITGGEPLVRRDCLALLRRLSENAGIESLHLTTNGVGLAPYCEELAALGIRVNLSLDTLDRRRFWTITRRDRLPAVTESLRRLLAAGVPVKINTVLLPATSDEEILALAELARRHPVTVRFIEPMPFAGPGGGVAGRRETVRGCLLRLFPALREEPAAGPGTAVTFRIPGWAGRLGCIEGYARRFCSGCNRVRITPAGLLKTCLYDDPALDLRALLRAGAADLTIAGAVARAVAARASDGFQAEARSVGRGKPSMATIGG